VNIVFKYQEIGIKCQPYLGVALVSLVYIGRSNCYQVTTLLPIYSMLRHTSVQGIMQHMES